LLHQAARDSVALAEIPTLPLAPYQCTVEFQASNAATAAALVPCVERDNDRTVTFSFDTIAETYRCFTVVTRMAKGAAEAVYG
jgi:D-aminopeptidase